MHEYIDVASKDLGVTKTTQALSLDGFCHEIGRALEMHKLCDVPRRVAGLLPNLLNRADLLTPAQRKAPAESYGRNRVFICPQDKFSVLAMVWPAGVTTPIHDHRDWCSLGVYEGMIEETYYSPATKAPDCRTAVPTKTVCHRPGAVAHMPLDAPNIHTIHNPTDDVAISIHVYGGNFEILGPNLGTIYTVA
jgi:predicted metal-dependent enzyme (double-stranded beta helix superfamily)